MANEGQEKKRGGAGKAVVGVGIIGVAAYLLLGRGGGFGLGNGLFPGAGGTGSASQTAQTETVTASTAPEEIPDTIVVKIAEQEVLINGNPVADEAALRRYIEEYNSDARKFVLEDENSILDTYEWVTDTFKDMGVLLEGAE